MQKHLRRGAIMTFAMGAAAIGGAQTYGNTSPFETTSSHSPNYVLGVQVTIPITLTLQSFGMIYGMTAQPAATNAIFGLYASGVADGLPSTRVAVTNPINVNTAQTYDNIPFTSNPTIGPGTYWMMALYETFAEPRMGLTDPNSLVAYWDNPYGSGMPGSSPGNQTYTGQNFNYWVNGVVPEPATMSILGLGALAMAFRRRRA